MALYRVRTSRKDVSKAALKKILTPNRSNANLASTSALHMQNSEQVLWRNDNESDEPDDRAEEEVIPPVAPETKIPAAKEQESEDEGLGLLTQYIAPIKSQATNLQTKTPTSKNVELVSLKKTFLEATGIIDRANNHKTFLDRALRTEKIPPKLEITIKPLVMKKDKALFQIKWNTVVKAAEETLIKCLIEHLEDILSKTNEELQTSTKEDKRRTPNLHQGDCEET